MTQIAKIETFGDARRLILETVLALRDGQIDIGRGMAIAANMKVLNDNIFAEVAATKLSLVTEGKAHDFGKIVRMGQRLIADNRSSDTPEGQTAP